MTLEELKEFLKDENNKVVFDEIVKSLGYKSQEEIEGLVNKNEQLLKKLVKKKEEFAEKQKLLDSIDVEAYNDYVNSEGDPKRGNSELNKIKRELKEAQDKVEKFSKIESDYNNSLKLSAIKDALIENKIDSKYTEILTSHFTGKAKVEIDDDSRSIVIEDDDGLGQSPNEYLKKWVETEKGQAYLAKPENTGAGSTGFSGSGGKSIKASELNSLSNNERKAISSDIAAGKITIVE